MSATLFTRKRLALSLGAVLVLGGCVQTPVSSPRKSVTYEQAAAHPFIPVNYQAADALLQQLQGRMPGDSRSVIVATLVNIDALDRSSTLGRLISEQLAGRFTQAGYRVIEMKLRNNVYMKQGQGELMLTREIQEIASHHATQAVVVGTYGESRDYVFVNLKVVQPGSDLILAVHDYALPIDDNVKSMLRVAR